MERRWPLNRDEGERREFREGRARVSHGTGRDGDVGRLQSKKLFHVSKEKPKERDVQVEPYEGITWLTLRCYC